jgi:hypothetical protein
VARVVYSPRSADGRDDDGLRPIAISKKRISVVQFDRSRTRPSEAVTIPAFAEMDFLVGTTHGSLKITVDG